MSTRRNEEKKKKKKKKKVITKGVDIYIPLHVACHSTVEWSRVQCDIFKYIRLQCICNNTI